MRRQNEVLLSRLRTAIPGIFVACSISFMLFIYAPLELYVLNQSEFWFPFLSIVKAALQNFLIFVGVSTILLVIVALIYPPVCKILTAVEMVALISCYVQGNFLVGNMPPFDGTDIPWENYRGENIKTLAVWIITTVVVVIVHKFWDTKRIVFAEKLISAGLGMVLLITLITLIFSTKAYQQRNTYFALERGMFDLSEDRNFIILLFDTIDSGNFNDILSADSSYKDVFEDFTYYPDMLGAHPWTMYTMQYLLSGKWYEGEANYLDYSADAVEESPLFRELAARDYDIALYEEERWVTSHTYEFSNMESIRNEVYVWKYFRRAICKLGGIRYAPFFLKEYCYRAPQQIQGQHNVIVEANEALYSWDMKTFLENLEERGICRQNKKCFKYYHFQGGHVPYLYDADMNFSADATHDDMVKASIEVSRQFLEKLKLSDVYDNSIIIILSDHGFDKENETSVYGRQNPVFMVKGIGERHAMETSLVPASFADLQEAYAKLLEGASGKEIFPYEEGQQRERRFLYYENTNGVMREWIQTGPAWDRDAHYETGVTYSKWY